MLRERMEKRRLKEKKSVCTVQANEIQKKHHSSEKKEVLQKKHLQWKERFILFRFSLVRVCLLKSIAMCLVKVQK